MVSHQTSGVYFHAAYDWNGQISGLNAQKFHDFLVAFLLRGGVTFTRQIESMSPEVRHNCSVLNGRDDNPFHFWVEPELDAYGFQVNLTSSDGLVHLPITSQLQPYVAFSTETQTLKLTLSHSRFKDGPVVLETISLQRK